MQVGVVSGIMIKERDGAIPIGYIIRYKLTVSNPNENNPIHNFVAIDELPTHLELVEGSINITPAIDAHIIETDNTNEIRVVFTTISAGSVVHIYFDAKVVGSGADGKIINIARICEYKPDPKGNLNDGRAGREVNRDDEIVDIKEDFENLSEPIIAPVNDIRDEDDSATEVIAETPSVLTTKTPTLTDIGSGDDSEAVAEDSSIFITKTSLKNILGKEDNLESKAVAEIDLKPKAVAEIDLKPKPMPEIDLEPKPMPEIDLEPEVVADNLSESNTIEPLTELTDVIDEDDSAPEVVGNLEQPVRSRLSALAETILAASGFAAKKIKRDEESLEISLDQKHEEEYKEIFWAENGEA